MRWRALNRCFRAARAQNLLSAVVVCLSIALFQHQANAQLVRTFRLGARQDFSPPQRGQRKPSGQRFLAK
jgi:hypothetical protein